MTRLAFSPFDSRSGKLESACVQLCQHAGLSDTFESCVLEWRPHERDVKDDKDECILIRVIRRSCICTMPSATVCDV
jgi:hypothetical protein